MMDEEIPLILERAADEPEYVPAIGVGFGLIAEKDEAGSKKAGYPIFVEREFISLRVPGDKNTHSLRRAKDKDRERYPKAYAAFKNRHLEISQGYPIEKWPQITRAEALSLKAMAIHTVEALAEVHDGNIEKLGHAGRELRAKAKSFMTQAKDTAEAQRLAAENEAQKAEMTELRRQIAELASKLDTPKRKAAAA